MNVYKNIISLFKHTGKEFNSINKYENLSEFSFEGSINELNIPELGSLKEALSLVTLSDFYTIFINIGQSDDIMFQKGDNINDFIVNITDFTKDKEENEFDRIKLNISKKALKRKISIYSFSAFLTYLHSLEMSDLLNIFNILTDTTEKGFNFFHLQTNNKINFSTKSFSISSNENDFTNEFIPPSTRANLIEFRNNICHFSNASQINLIPDDFTIIKKINRHYV